MAYYNKAMLRLYLYDQNSRVLCDTITPADLPGFLKRQDGVLWVDLCQPNPDELALLSDVFGFHPLCVEDCTHPQAIPKLEEFADYLFLVVHGVKQSQGDNIRQKLCEFETLELDVFLGRNFLVTVHAEPLRSIEITQENLLRGSSAIHISATALAHEVLDALVDLYFPVLETLEIHLQNLEDIIEANPASDIVKDFFDLRRTILQLRRTSLKQQEIFYGLSHRDISFISKPDVLLFRDIYDHMVRIVEMSESSREILSGILNIHLSLVSNRMNDVMRILTIFSAILLPLTFIVGIYGMNFEHMPELRNPYGYYTVLCFMALITLGMLGYFRYKRWL